jgi:hypothetical protein
VEDGGVHTVSNIAKWFSSITFLVEAMEAPCSKMSSATSFAAPARCGALAETRICGEAPAGIFVVIARLVANATSWASPRGCSTRRASRAPTIDAIKQLLMAPRQRMPLVGSFWQVITTLTRAHPPRARERSRAPAAAAAQSCDTVRPHDALHVSTQQHDRTLARRVESVWPSVGRARAYSGLLPSCARLLAA